MPHALGQILCYAERMRQAVMESTDKPSPFAVAERAGNASLYICVPSEPDDIDKVVCENNGVKIWVEADPVPL